MQCAGVRVAEDRDGGNPHASRGRRDAHRDLAAVGDE
jgi:hypothetical protein